MSTYIPLPPAPFEFAPFQSAPVRAPPVMVPPSVPALGISPLPPTVSPMGTSGSAAGTKHTHKAKPANIFSNDGSFLDRFQRLKEDEEERKKQEEILEQKRKFDERFKRRGKRASSSADSRASSTPPANSKSSSDKGSSSASPSPGTDDPAEPPAKKAKVDPAIEKYQNEVKNYEDKTLKDQGVGVRPLCR